MSKREKASVRTNDIVRQRIKEIACRIGMRYVFASVGEANVILDNGDFPVLLEVLPLTGRVDVQLGQFKDAPNCTLFFVDKTELDYNAEREQPTIARMKQKAFEFIAECNRSGYFEPITTANYELLYDRLDVTVSGVALNVQLQDAIGVCV